MEKTLRQTNGGTSRAATKRGASSKRGAGGRPGKAKLRAGGKPGTTAEPRTSPGSTHRPTPAPGPHVAGGARAGVAATNTSTTAAAMVLPAAEIQLSAVSEHVEALLRRARSAIGRRIVYKLGGGGMSPTSPTPANMDNACDCSGFVCWALGLSRQTTHPLYVRFNGGWINTDAMVHDARSQTGFFTRLEEPRVGCLVVYPSRLPTRKVGHVGIVTGVAPQNGRMVVTQVLHCSRGSFVATGDAIAQTPPTVFAKPDAIYAWYEGLG